MHYTLIAMVEKEDTVSTAAIYSAVEAMTQYYDENNDEFFEPQVERWTDDDGVEHTEHYEANPDAKFDYFIVIEESNHFSTRIEDIDNPPVPFALVAPELGWTDRTEYGPGAWSIDKDDSLEEEWNNKFQELYTVARKHGYVPVLLDCHT